jgi:hypothetical protein
MSKEEWNGGEVDQIVMRLDTLEALKYKLGRAIRKRSSINRAVDDLAYHNGRAEAFQEAIDLITRQPQPVAPVETITCIDCQKTMERVDPPGCDCEGPIEIQLKTGTCHISTNDPIVVTGSRGVTFMSARDPTQPPS